MSCKRKHKINSICLVTYFLAWFNRCLAKVYYAHTDSNISVNSKNIHFRLLKNESDSLKIALKILDTKSIHERKIHIF